MLTKNNLTESELMSSNQIAEYVPYQKCPKCDGQGIVSKPPYVSGDIFEWSSSSVSWQCNVCNGAKIIPMHRVDSNTEKR